MRRSKHTKWLLGGTILLALIGGGAAWYHHVTGFDGPEYPPSDAWASLHAEDRNAIQTAITEAKAERSPTGVSWLDDRSVVVGEKNGSKTTLTRINIATGAREALIAGRSPEVSPDGKRIAYVHDRQIRIYDLASKTSRDAGRIDTVGAVSQFVFPILPSDYAWSNDGGKLAFARPRVNVFGLPNGAELLLWEATTGQSRRLATIDGDGIGGLSWTAGDNEVMFARGPLDAGPASISAVSLRGTIRTIKPIPGGSPQVISPSASPTQPGVLHFNYDPSRESIKYTNGALSALVVGNGQARVVQPERLVGLSSFVDTAQWSRNGSFAWTSCFDGPFDRAVCRISPDGKGRLFASSRIERYATFAVAPDGRRLAIIAHDPMTGTASLKIGDPEKGSFVYLPLDRGKGAAEPQFRSEEVRWTAPDGLALRGVYIHPEKRIGSGPPPMIVYVHGGPYGGVSVTGELLNGPASELAFWAERGYAQFLPDYRGNMAYGTRRFWDAVATHRFMGVFASDVLSGVDAMVGRGLGDRDRLALVGHSWGSAIASWIAGNDGRFKAVVSKEGWNSFYPDDMGSTDSDENDEDILFGGSPSEAPEAYAFNSAITRADRVKAPILLFSAAPRKGGDFDKFCDGINRSKGNCRHFRFPKEEHVFGNEASMRIVFAETARLFARHVANWR